MAPHRIAVIGAGLGGLAAAADLARSGAHVTVFEKAAAPGGKMREVRVGGTPIDAGPTVFTMRWIFEGLFADAGASFDNYVTLTRATTLARHAWPDGGTLDLFADVERSADAVAAFAGASEAQGYRDFCARSADVYRTLAPTFIAAERPSPVELVRRVGFSNINAMWRTAPYATYWAALGRHFTDPRLRQLFGRYATYCGSSPWQAPATLMLVAHVEQDGVWLVSGGMRKIATAIQSLGEKNGAVYRYGQSVDRLIVRSSRVTGLKLASGEEYSADAIVFNGDVSALPAGMFGEDVRGAAAPTPTAKRSLSAITWCARAPTSGFPLLRHNVFFGTDYADEFSAIFNRRTLTVAPTVYICAQDRETGTSVAEGSAERLLILVNAPADGDAQQDATRWKSPAILKRVSALLEKCGLRIDFAAGATVITTPDDFAALFPGSGGGLYGRASHGAQATFARPGAISNIKGLYFAGGTVHPGPGIPMATMSGRIAAARVLDDLAHPARWLRAAVRLDCPQPADPAPSAAKSSGRRHNLVENLR